MATFSELLIENIHSYGLFDIFLPWLLLLVVTFGVIDQVPAFSKKRNIQILVSILISTFAILSPLGSSLAEFLSLFSAKLGALMVTVMVGSMITLVLWKMVASYTGGNTQIENAGNYVFWGALIGVIVIFITSGGLNLIGTSLGIKSIKLSPDTVVAIGTLGFFVIMFLVLYMLLKSDEHKNKHKHHEKMVKERLEWLLGKGSHH